ncbi:hypothetical protein [Actinoplanes sp. NPDC049599]|uniref:hypothetical protein n=1 Tax=Actinoplanes sp. NPDC049599 TaxID=3363903 RepID=UPI0037B08E10
MSSGCAPGAARLIGLATAAVLAATAAAPAAAGLRPGAGVSVQLLVGVVAALVNVGVVALLLPAPCPEPLAAAPTGVIDLGDR